MHTPMTRRSFFRSSMAGAAALGLTRRSRAEDPAPWTKAFEHYTDPETGARVYALTPGPQKDDIIYQTHPMWTPGMRHLVFNSNRTSGVNQPHALDMATGEARPLLEGGGAPAYSLAWQSADMVYVLDREVFALETAAACNGGAKPRRIAALPAEAQRLSGTLTVDAGETTLYAGVELEEEKRWGILALDLKSGAWSTPAEVDFQVGHLQAHPRDSRHVLFCHETGGFARQRMWLLDTESGEHRPLYQPVGRDWVTHEAWWGDGRVIFTIWPYDEERKQLPHGVCWTRVQDGVRRVLAQYPAWHTHGSPDMRWAMGDDFDRSLWLIDADSGERRLLTQGHTTGEFKTHPHGSFTPDSRGIVFNSSRNGTADIFLAELPAWESLPSA